MVINNTKVSIPILRGTLGSVVTVFVIKSRELFGRKGAIISFAL